MSNTNGYSFEDDIAHISKIIHSKPVKFFDFYRDSLMGKAKPKHEIIKTKFRPFKS